MSAILVKGERLFAGALSTYSADFGIDYEAIMNDVFSEYEADAEQETEDGARTDFT